MSKLTDYSKFDNLDEGDPSDEDNNGGSKSVPQPAQPPPEAAASSSAVPSMYKNEANGRFVFSFNGHPIYEWEQTLDDITLFVKPPPFVTKGNQIVCKIEAHHLKLGLEGVKTFFLNEDTYGTVDVSESTWSLESEDDGSKTITMYLTKANRGQVWESALKGNQALALDPATKEQVQRDLILERFQEENPGMDFRGAEFNGSVPDPRTFMGGLNARK